MSYSSGISGGSNLYDMFRYRQALADQQTSAASGQSVWPNFSQGSPTSTASSSSSSSSSTSSSSTTSSSAGSAQSAATATAGSTASLSSALANLLMEFQQVLGQMEQNPDGSAAPGSTASTTATGTATGTTAASATDGTTTASASDPSQQTAATQPHHHHHHHHQESQSDSSTTSTASTGSTGTAASSDPLAQLLGTAADGSGGTVTKSAFEQAFANGENTAKADKIFGKIDQNSDGTIDQSEAQNALKHLQQPWNAAGMQSPFGTSQTGGQGSSSQGSWLSGSNLLLMAQQMGQAA